MGPDEKVTDISPEKKPMTDEEVKAKSFENKKTAFAERPDEFFHMSEMVVCAVQTGEGLMYYINPTKSGNELHIAMGQLGFNVTLALMKMKDAAKMKKPNIVIPGMAHMKRGLRKLKH